MSSPSQSGGLTSIKGCSFSAGQPLSLPKKATDDHPSLPLRTATPPQSRKFTEPFNLEKENEEWAENLKRITAAQFLKGGSRICLPFSAGERWLGCAILADRVNGLPYTVEELDLLKCIGDHIAADLSNLRLTEELMVTKELEAFQTMSAFFVHDLKNAASSLGLTMQNLRVHFDDPEFPGGRAPWYREHSRSHKSADRSTKCAAEEAGSETDGIRPERSRPRKP